MNIQLDDDRALMLAARAGDMRATSQLCARHLPIVSRWASRLVAPDMVDDLTQATMLAGLAGLHRCGSAWIAYLRGIILRQAATLRRRRRWEALPELATMPGCDQALELSRIMRSVASLPAPYGEAVELAIVGMSTREAAAAMGCSEHTARSRLARGRAALRSRELATGLSAGSGS